MEEEFTLLWWFDNDEGVILWIVTDKAADELLKISKKYGTDFDDDDWSNAFDTWEKKYKPVNIGLKHNEVFDIKKLKLSRVMSLGWTE